MLARSRVSRKQQQPMHHDTGRRFIHVPPAQEVIRAMRAKIATTVNTAPKKVERAASANDNPLAREAREVLGNHR